MRVCATAAISPQGQISHLRCYADGGRRGSNFEDLRASFKQRYPAADGSDDYTMNDYLAIEGNDNRVCKIACVAFCPLGKQRIPDVMRRVRGFDSVVPQVGLDGFPPAHDFDLEHG